MKKILTELLFLPLCIYFLEVCSHFMLFSASVDASLYIFLFSSLVIGCLLTFLITLFKGWFQKALFIIVLFGLGALFAFHMIYYQIFRSFFLWNTIGLAGDVTAFYREALTGMKENWYMIAAAFVPLLVYVIFVIRIKLEPHWKERLSFVLLGLIGAASLGIILVNPDNRAVMKHMQEDATTCYYQYGTVTATGVDLYQLAFGVEDDDIIEVPDNLDQLGKTDVRVTETKLILKNAFNIDFNKMISKAPNDTIKNMHKYFQSKEATSQNDYTGYFAGKNLIFLTLEGFSYKAMSPEITPTLWKMYTQGFCFTNFYDALWGGSTATGEYSNMTGNFYTSASCLNMSSSTLQPMAMGNIFKNAGYATYAYHNGNYTYYSRNKSHPNFGYQVYKGINGPSGSNLVLQSYAWPNSDYLMAKATIKEYINSSKPFHTYYMTISGHTYYTWSGNVMARSHQKEVQGLPYTDEVKPYIATQVEVENCVEYLCEQLEKAGKLNDTVIAMCCDHYPYGLSDEGLAELYDLPLKNIRGNFETYHNAFILWCASMEEPVIIDTPCAAYDILPTLANLFGLEYDSRFYTGTDILSDTENVAIINTLSSSGGSWNWKTTQGTYYTVTKKFVKSDTCTLNSEQEINAYVKKINNRVNQMKKYSYAILDNNYYKYVFNKNGKPLYTLQD